MYFGNYRELDIPDHIGIYDQERAFHKALIDVDYIRYPLSDQWRRLYASAGFWLSK